jgi:HSP20 family protein
MGEKDIGLKLEGNVLTLHGIRHMEDTEVRDSFHRVESLYGSFSRSYALPDTVDRDQIKAEYKNGILTVTIPQRPEMRPRSIPVSVH